MTIVWTFALASSSSGAVAPAAWALAIAALTAGREVADLVVDLLELGLDLGLGGVVFLGAGAASFLKSSY